MGWGRVGVPRVPAATAGGQGDAAVPPAFSDVAGARPPRAGGPASPLAPAAPTVPRRHRGRDPSPRATHGLRMGKVRGGRIGPGSPPVAVRAGGQPFPPGARAVRRPWGRGLLRSGGGCRGGLKGSQARPRAVVTPTQVRKGGRGRRIPLSPRGSPRRARGRPRPHPTATPHAHPQPPRSGKSRAEGAPTDRKATAVVPPRSPRLALCRGPCRDETRRGGLVGRGGSRRTPPGRSSRPAAASWRSWSATGCSAWPRRSPARSPGWPAPCRTTGSTAAGPGSGAAGRA